MREPPADLTDDALGDCLGAQYGLRAREVRFLALGQDSSAWVYEVTADSARYFMKVRRNPSNRAGLEVPRFLREHGVDGIVAPMPNAAGTLSSSAAGYAVSLYPFVEGQTAMARGLSGEQWSEYGRMLRQVHTVVPTPDLLAVMPRETFTPLGDAVRRLDAHVYGGAFDDQAAQTIAAFWRESRALIAGVVERAEDFGRRLAGVRHPFLVCHADIHTNNVLVDGEGGLWIVDWDDAVLAPKERDLMFVVGGISERLVGPREEAIFLRGYGKVVLDPLALAYYRYAWAVSDIAAYGEQVFLRSDLGPSDVHEAVERFQRLFEPGEIVSLAQQSEMPPA